MKLIRDILRDIENTSLSEIFNIFALISLALFPLVYYMNRSAADSGFMFAFICLSAGVVLKMVQEGGLLFAVDFPIFFRYVKFIIFAVLSIFFLYPGYRLLGIPGAMIFLPLLAGIIFWCGCDKKKPIFFEDTEKYSFGRKDIYYIGALVFLNLFSIRKLLISEPVVYYDWPGFRLDALDSLHLNNVFQTNPYELIASPLLLLFGNELASNVFLLMWIPIAGVTFYCLAARVLRNRISGLIASFIYIFNPAVLDRFLSAHLGILIGYAMMPLIILLFILSLDNRNSKKSIVFSLMAGVLLAFTGLMASHFFYLTALLLGLFLLFSSVMDNLYKSLKKGVPLLALILFVAVVLASPWLFSAVKDANSGQYSSIATLSYVESLSTQTYLYNNFRLIGQSGAPFVENLGYTSMSIWHLLGFITVLLGFSANLLHRKEKEKTVVVFSLITLIGLLLSTGTMYPGGLYQWLFLNFPFFFAFREPSKFLILAGFGISILAGITVDAVLSMKRDRRGKILVPMLISGVLLSQAIFAWPMFTGDNMLYSQHPRYTITKEYRELGAWMDSNNETYKIMILPYSGFTIRTWQIVSKKEFVYIGTASLSPSNSDIYQYSIFMLETLERGDASGFSILAGLEGIKYVVVQKDLDIRNVQEAPDDYNFIPPFNRFNQSGPMLVQLLETSKEFRKMKEFGPYIVFENLRFMKRTGREKPVLAIGDRNLIFEMAKRPDFNEKELVFANKLTPSALAVMVNNTETIVSNVDKNERQFSMLDNAYKINVYDDAFPAGLGDNPGNIIYKKWIRSDIFEFLEGGVFGKGAVTYGRGYAITRGNAELNMTYSSPKDGHYQLWVRLLYAPARGGLRVSLDNEKVMEINPESPDFIGFRWVMIGDVNMTNRIHNVKIMNSNGENVIDQIVFFPSG